MAGNCPVSNRKLDPVFVNLCWDNSNFNFGHSFDISNQALMYPLLVACKSISILRQRAAQEVVDKIRQHSGGLVDQVRTITF
jgi:hypothetical protein